MSKTAMKTEVERFVPEWGEPNESGLQIATNGPHDLFRYKDGGLAIKVTQRGKSIGPANYVVCGKAYAESPGWKEFLDDYVAQAAISATSRAAGPTKGKGTGHVFYYAADSEQHGPFNAVDFQNLVLAGKVKRDTLVYHSAMATPAWVNAKTDADMLAMLAKVPPPMPKLAT